MKGRHHAIGLVAVLLLAGLLLAQWVSAWDYYLDAVNGYDGNDGTRRDYAWRTLTKALQEAEPTIRNRATFHLAEGTYSGPTTYETFPVILRSHVRVVGEGPDKTIIDACGLDHHVFVCDDVWDVCISDATLRGAHALYHGANNPDGGCCILCNESVLTVQNCVIEENAGMEYGDAGGIHCVESELTLINSIVRHNSADVRPGPGGGASPGGFRCHGSLALIERCTFESNSDGAIKCVGSGVLIADSFILNNTGHFAIENSGCDLVIDSTVLSNNRGYIIKSYGATLTMFDCLVQGNVRNESGGTYENGVFSDRSDVRIEDCVIRRNIGANTGHHNGTIRAVAHGSLAISRCALLYNESRDPTIEIVSHLESESDYVELTVEDTLLCNNLNERGAVLYFWRSRTLGCDPASDASIRLRGCTVVGNRSNGQDNEKRYVIENDSDAALTTLLMEDCIVWDNDGRLLRHPASEVPYEVKFNNCCLQEEFAGEGNFVADPLFASGPLGDYYLSAIEAGQHADSPCIDAGSTSASSAGVNDLTTRTDGAFDTDAVDIGYHYSATPPTIECEAWDGSDALDERPFQAGDTLIASVTVENGGQPLWADVYAGFIAPDGSILFVSSGGLQSEPAPFLETVLLPQSLPRTRINIFETQLPSGIPEGTYTFAAVLSLTGGFRPIGEIALDRFMVGASSL